MNWCRHVGLIALSALSLISILPHAKAADTSGKKVLRVVGQTINPGPIDPAHVNSSLGATIIENIFEPMLQYDYLARPLKVVPNTLTALPVASGGGLVWICHLKRGILFAPDPVFKGKPRELTAGDYAYSIRRLFDPRYLSSQFFMVDGKIVGANALRDAALAGKPFDYDTPIAGLTVVDRYTLKITLTEPDLNFLHVLAQQNLAAVAREVVEHYGAGINQHPVGTGPFRVVQFLDGSRITLERNPNFRHEVFDADPGNDERAQAIYARLKGRRLPMVDRVEFNMTVEDQPLWLAFLKRDYDYLTEIPPAFLPGALIRQQLVPALARQGIGLQQYAYPSIWFTEFNMKDPVVGGYTAEKVALRRAISLAFDHQASIDVARYGAGLPAYGVVPPGVAGHDAAFRTPVFQRDISRARALLDVFGYVDRDGDGWRETPDGKPLVLELISPQEPRFRVWDELYAKAFASLGVKLNIRKMHSAEANLLQMTAKYQVQATAWNMDYPDAEDFYVILHGPASGNSNGSHFALPEYDRVFEKSKKLLDSPERSALYRQLDKLVAAYLPISIHLYMQRSAVTQPWLIGYMPHSIHLQPWKYVDIDLAAKAKWQGRGE